MGISLHKVNKRNTLDKQFTASKLNFTHSVASGDPVRKLLSLLQNRANEEQYHDSVILWTRCAPMFDSVTSNTSVSGYVPLYNHGPEQVSTAPVSTLHTLHVEAVT